MADSKLNADLVLRRAFDDTTDRLQVDATIGAISVTLDAASDDVSIKGSTTGYELGIQSDGSINANVIVSAATGDNIAISDGVDTLGINSNGSIDVNVISGGGSSATQYADGAARGTATGTLSMGDDGTNIQSVKVNSSGELQVGVVGTVPISAASLPLPAGAATSALQTTGNTSVASIDTKLTGVALDTSVNTLLKPASTLAAVTTVGTITNVVHVDDNAGSLTVDGTFWQATQPVSAASLPLPAGASTSALQTTGNTSVASIDTKTPALGQALAAASVPVVLTAAQVTTLTPLSSVTANAGTNLNTSALALSATQTDGTQKAIARGAAKGTTTAADITSTNQSADRSALDVQIRTSAGVPVDTFGGGTQYTEDAVADADPVGNATILVRKDTPAAIVSADGDNIAQRGTNYGAAYTQIVTSAGAFVDTFGGGTQYADGAARGTATGTVAMGDDGTNIQSVKVNSSGELQVGIVGTPTVTTTPSGVSATGNITTVNLVPTGTATAGSAVEITDTKGMTTLGIYLTGTWTATINIQVSTDGVLWRSVLGSRQIYSVDGNDYSSSSGLSNTTNYKFNCAGYKAVRVTATAFTSGTVGVQLAVTAGGINDGTGRTVATIASWDGSTVVTGNGVNSGALRVAIASDNTAFAVNDSLVSTANSSVATLGIGGVFTGTSENVSNYAQIQVAVFADQASATDGLSVQQSTDGTNWDITDVFTVPASTGKTFSFGVAAKFVRIVYTNGGTANTVFRLQTVYHKYAIKGSSQRPQDARSNENDMDETLSYIMGYNGTSWDRLRSTTANGLAVDVTRNAALVAGSALIGKVGIDQTTVGTTNAVSVAQIGATTVATGNGVSTAGVQRTVAAREQTYRASTIIPLVAAVTVNVPFFNIIGSATKTVTVKKITVSGMTLTAVGYYAINVEKLSTASTGGTSTTLVATTMDTNNNAVTAVVKAYTVAGTKGTLVGTLRSWRALWQATVAAAGGVTDYYDFTFADSVGSGGVVLRGVAQELALTFPVVLASAGTLSVDIEWTEE